MAISAVNKLANSLTNSAGQTTVSTASITPTANSIVFACIQFRGSLVAGFLPTISGAGMTWTLVSNTPIFTSNTLFMWRGQGTPSTGTITWTRNSTSTWDQALWSVFEFTGANLTTPLVTANTITGTSVTNGVGTITYAQNFAVGSTGVAFFGAGGGGGSFLPRIGWTEIDDQNVGANCLSETQYINGPDNQAQATANLTAFSPNGIAVELQMAAETRSTITGITSVTT